MFGHRGAGCSVVGGEAHVPENSMSAFELAASHGIDVELDVWMTRDREVVVLHGGGPEGFLSETVITDQVNNNTTIEDISYKEFKFHGFLALREPWIIFKKKKEIKKNYENGLLSNKSEENADYSNCIIVKKYWTSSKSERDRERFQYLKSGETFKNNEDSVNQVPLLREVFERFMGRLRFNVELKGSNPLIGSEVLKIAENFPGIIAKISSFEWNRKNDLLLPIVHNPLGIRIALLYHRKDIFGTEKILADLKKYSAQDVHLPQRFLLRNGIEDIEKVKKALFTNPRISTLLDIITSKYSETVSGPECKDDPKYSSDYFGVTRKDLEVETLHLFHCVRQLHRHHKNILIYSGKCSEDPALLELQRLCGVDQFCLNNIKIAVGL